MADVNPDCKENMQSDQPDRCRCLHHREDIQLDQAEQQSVLEDREYTSAQVKCHWTVDSSLVDMRSM